MSRTAHSAKPFAVFMLDALLLSVSFMALPAGIMFMFRPDGSLLGMLPGWLSNSPFKSYFFPGLILFLCIGVFPLITFFGLLGILRLPIANTINIYRNRHWAWSWSLYSGIMLITWITVQLIMTPYFWLQSAMIFAGVIIIILTLLPSTIRYYEIKKRGQR